MPRVAKRGNTDGFYLVQEGDEVCLMLDGFYVAVIKSGGMELVPHCYYKLHKHGIAHTKEEGRIKIDHGKDDYLGRVWMHCEEGLTLTNASMGRFLTWCLLNRVEIGEIYPFNIQYKGSVVIASVRLKPDQFEAFERETGGKLRKPPKIVLS